MLHEKSVGTEYGSMWPEGHLTLESAYSSGSAELVCYHLNATPLARFDWKFRAHQPGFSTVRQGTFALVLRAEFRKLGVDVLDDVLGDSLHGQVRDEADRKFA